MAASSSSSIHAGNLDLLPEGFFCRFFLRAPSRIEKTVPSSHPYRMGCIRLRVADSAAASVVVEEGDGASVPIIIVAVVAEEEEERKDAATCSASGSSPAASMISSPVSAGDDGGRRSSSSVSKKKGVSSHTGSMYIVCLCFFARHAVSTSQLLICTCSPSGNGRSYIWNQKKTGI